MTVLASPFWFGVTMLPGELVTEIGGGVASPPFTSLLIKNVGAKKCSNRPHPNPAPETIIRAALKVMGSLCIRDGTHVQTIKLIASNTKPILAQRGNQSGYARAAIKIANPVLRALGLGARMFLILPLSNASRY